MILKKNWADKKFVQPKNKLSKGVKNCPAEHREGQKYLVL